MNYFKKGGFHKPRRQPGGRGVGQKNTKNHVGGRGGQAKNHVDIFPKINFTNLQFLYENLSRNNTKTVCMKFYLSNITTFSLKRLGNVFKIVLKSVKVLKRSAKEPRGFEGGLTKNHVCLRWGEGG